MTNMRRAKGPARKRRAARAGEAFRHSVFLLADTMEQSLQQAAQIVFVLTLLDTRHDDISAPIAVVAGEARDKLDETRVSLERLFRLLRQ